ncbi:MAG: dipicolinate synthase subunit DpsA [Eubacterium sp.]|jgi:dipicolinate synthase subunit A|nr:dipicolinate synthase subunit DpsA [Eubacterium sp.]
MNNFLFLGGDLRSVYAAEKLNERFDCFIYGQENLWLPTPIQTPVLREVTKCRNLVLGLPSSCDGETINAPNWNETIYPEIILEAVENGGTVFAGKAFEKLSSLCEKHGFKFIDYFAREELAVMNAIPTVEGAIEILMRESSSTIYDMSVLVTGFGRLGKVLIKRLVALGAQVTVAARKFSDMSWAEIGGCKSMHISELEANLSRFDAVINTIPAKIFFEKEIKKMSPCLIFIDLASKLSVFDKAFIERQGIKVLWELSLPGRVAPVTAGRVIADTILNIIAETRSD